MATTSEAPVQINAAVSPAVRDELDRFTEKRGLKKNFVIEEALSRYMHAAGELPSDIVINPRIVLTEAGIRRFEEALAAPPKPTPALRALMSRGRKG